MMKLNKHILLLQFITRGLNQSWLIKNRRRCSPGKGSDVKGHLRGGPEMDVSGDAATIAVWRRSNIDCADFQSDRRSVTPEAIARKVVGFYSNHAITAHPDFPLPPVRQWSTLSSIHICDGTIRLNFFVKILLIIFLPDSIIFHTLRLGNEANNGTKSWNNCSNIIL